MNMHAMFVSYLEEKLLLKIYLLELERPSEKL
jgi:hypothetical protein